MFKIKCYSKAELAMLYFPDSEPKVAVNHLMRWVYKCKPLMDDLNKTGYRKQAKFFLNTNYNFFEHEFYFFEPE